MNTDHKKNPTTGGRGLPAFLTRTLSIFPAVAALLLAGAQAAVAATFEITAMSCMTSPGGYWWALQQANANPGRDTIQFRTSITVDDCRHFPAEQYPDLHVTESVDIVGNGFTVYGNVGWVNPDGHFNSHGHCPNPVDVDTWVGYGGGFIDIGRRNSDNQGIEVTITGLKMSRLTGVAIVRKNAKLRIENAFIQDIYSVYHEQCNSPIIEGIDHSDITIVDTLLDRISVPEEGFTDTRFPVVTSAIKGNGGQLVMDRVKMGGVYGDHTTGISWFGGTVKIVNSQFINSSGIWVESGTLDFVNSTYFAGIAGLEFKDNFLIGNVTANIQASTFWWGQWGDGCDWTRPGAKCPPRILGFDAVGSTIRFEGSALGVWEVASYPVLTGTPSQFTSDDKTWIQPRTRQGAAAIHAILPNALTALPGLYDYPSFNTSEYLHDITPLLGTPSQPGVLIDAIADCAANPLINPIDSSTITTDVFGNPRCDIGNDKRNIGAVQLTLSPHLFLNASRNSFVDLSWTWPPDPSTGAIDGYTLQYRVKGSGGWTSRSMVGATTLSTRLTGLTNGRTYEFQIAAHNAVGNGPFGNLVEATIAGLPGAPNPLTGAGAPTSRREILKWATPPNHGSPMTGYIILYRRFGGTAWTPWPFIGTGITTTVTGLAAGINYEFKVAAVNGNGAGPYSQTVTGPYQACDVNGNGSVNKTDIALITAARNTRAAAGDVRDQNHNGVIDLYDARQCTLRCAKPLCAR